MSNIMKAVDLIEWKSDEQRNKVIGEAHDRAMSGDLDVKKPLTIKSTGNGYLVVESPEAYLNEFSETKKNRKKNTHLTPKKKKRK